MRRCTDGEWRGTQGLAECARGDLCQDWRCRNNSELAPPPALAQCRPDSELPDLAVQTKCPIPLSLRESSASSSANRRPEISHTRFACTLLAHDLLVAPFGLCAVLCARRPLTQVGEVRDDAAVQDVWPWGRGEDVCRKRHVGCRRGRGRLDCLRIRRGRDRRHRCGWRWPFCQWQMDHAGRRRDGVLSRNVRVYMLAARRCQSRGGSDPSAAANGDDAPPGQAG